MDFSVVNVLGDLATSNQLKTIAAHLGLARANTAFSEASQLHIGSGADSVSSCSPKKRWQRKMMERR